MITFKNQPPVFRAFTVSFDIDTKEEAIAFMNACSTIANVNTIDIVNIWDSQKSTNMDMRMISDKMAVGKDWRDLIEMNKP